MAVPNVLYVMAHAQWKALKIGIGVCTGYNSRLIQHRRQGWILIHSRTFPTGAAAKDVEQAVLARLTAAGLAPFVTKKLMPNGWTETCDISRISADQVWAMVTEEADQAQPVIIRADGTRRLTAHGLFDPATAADQMRAAGLEPLEPYPGRANLPWRCRCTTCGNEGTPRLAGIRGGRGGCRPCGNATARAAEVATNAPIATAAMLAAGFEPLESYTGSGSPWRCRCTRCGKESTPRFDNARSGRSGCRHCAGRGPGDPGQATADMRAAGLEPLAPYPGASEPWPCRCTTCGNKVTPRLSSVRRGTGCRYCGVQRRSNARRGRPYRSTASSDATLF
ncbi:hypothetical protein ACIGXM_25180 [Kitasatospora sp. NPDC052896]|uniref:hypothetical protein n=1 Tax=Kitasatospora sp. NPDC052896 TaxID=3364061 RepID=UPI0037CAC50F